MQKELQKGVTLNCISTTKFKTIHILFRFQANVDEVNFSNRALLSSLLETSTQKYPTQAIFSKKLAELYGASFSTHVSRKGNYHFFNLSMQITNDKYLKNARVLKESIALIREVLFAPNKENELFHEETFSREKQNMLQYMTTEREDKQYYASLKGNELFFQGTSQVFPPYGSYQLMQEVQNEAVVAEHKKMLEKDLLNIFVLGDINEEEVVQYMKELPFSDRANELGELFYRPDVPEKVSKKTEHENILQSKLHLAFTHPVYYQSKDYYTMQLFNGILGGFSTSKLFQNVREKESMAYYIHSSFDSFRGQFVVQTGIDGKNVQRVTNAIDKEIEAIKSGDIREEEIKQAKAMLINAVILSQDSASNLIEQAYMKQLFPAVPMEVAAITEKIEAVTIKDIAQLAGELRLKSVFFLCGDSVENKKEANKKE